MSQDRKLAAIMFTDIKGYTALMQEDEQKAFELRNRHREAFEMTTEAFNGEILQYFGDGTLSVFKSSVEAVECAIEMQLAFLKHNIPVRIGIHVGDIMFSKDDIIGDAVNVASRIESCADAGSVLISDKVHDQIRSHPHIKTQFLDAYEFKNVDNAIPIFALANKGLVVPDSQELKGKFKEETNKSWKSNSSKKINALFAAVIIVALSIFVYLQFSKNNKPNIKNYSIAVLPFDNLSTDDDAEIFRDGMTEDILTNLSKLKELHVISRTSVMQYKNTEKTIPEIAKELGVSYILEGSVRKYGDKIRVTAQLIEASSDEHLWADNYDKTLTDIFAIQTEVSEEIVEALELNISFEEKESITEVPKHNIEAYKLFLKGRQEADKRNAKSLDKSIDLFEQAIKIDPNYAEAYAEIANSIYLQTYYSGRNYIEAAKVANEYVAKAENIDSRISRIYSVKGLILNIEGKRDLAKTAFSKALTLSPNDLTARHQFATLHYYTKEYDKQLEQAEMAYRLDPLSFASANAYFTALLTNKKYEEAEKLIKKIDEDGIENDQISIYRSYFRLYMDLRDYEKAIFYSEKIVDDFAIYNRFLGYCYAKVGDITGAYRMIDDVKKRTPDMFKSHQLAVIYSGLQKRDSVFYYLDPTRNKMKDLIVMDRPTFFTNFEGDSKFIELLKAHGIE